MRVEITESNALLLKEVFNSIVFESESGEKLAVCMRDSGFDIAYIGEWGTNWYEFREGQIES